MVTRPHDEESNRGAGVVAIVLREHIHQGSIWEHNDLVPTCVETRGRIINIAGRFPTGTAIGRPGKPGWRTEKNVQARVGINISTPDRINKTRLLWISSDGIFVQVDCRICVKHQGSWVTPCRASIGGPTDQNPSVGG